LGTRHRTKTIQRHTGRIGHKSQNKDNTEAYRQNWAQGTEQRQSRDIQAELDTRHRTKTIQRHTGRIGHNAQNKDNPETYRHNWAQGTEQRQSRDIQAELGTRHSTKTDTQAKKHNTKKENR
jgi:hypothetical protein